MTIDLLELRPDAMEAAAARHSPAAPGAAERAYRYTREAGGDDADRRRALAARRSLGRPRRRPITGELSLVVFGAPPAIVVELDHVAPDGAPDQHNHALEPDGARALRERIAAPPFAWRASAGGCEIVSRTGDGAAAAEPGRNEPCPCGSGRKYKRCCGS